jgi:hypothetical protein
MGLSQLRHNQSLVPIVFFTIWPYKATQIYDDECIFQIFYTIFYNSAVTKKKITLEEISKLAQDIQTLRRTYAQKEIALKMQWNDGNFSTYINDVSKISLGFINDFYAVWGEELNSIYEKQAKTYLPPAVPINANEDKNTYKEDGFIGLQKSFDKLADAHLIATESQKIHAESHKIAVKAGEKLIDVYAHQQKYPSQTSTNDPIQLE